jgi:hypothetical protein
MMNPNTHPARTTGEYAIAWQAIVEDHLSDELIDSLRRLTWISWGTNLPAHQIGAVLAHHLAHALRIAASPGGGVQPSIDYLRWAAAAQGGRAQVG